MNDRLETIDTTREAEGFRLTCACEWTTTGFDECELGDEYAAHVAETGELVSDHLVDEITPTMIEIEIDPAAIEVTDDLLSATDEDLDDDLSDHDTDVLAGMIVAKLPDCPLDEWESLGLATIEIFTDDNGEQDYRAMQLNRNGLRVFGRVLARAIKRG